MPLLVGKAANQVPTNGLLGTMAFQDSKTIVIKPPASVTPAESGDLVIEATNNTTLTLRMRGTDGVARSVALTLA